MLRLKGNEALRARLEIIEKYPELAIDL